MPIDNTLLEHTLTVAKLKKAYQINLTSFETRTIEADRFRQDNDVTLYEAYVINNPGNGTVELKQSTLLAALTMLRRKGKSFILSPKEITLIRFKQPEKLAGMQATELSIDEFKHK